ncbi:MAG: prepilin peptidase [Elusimicrobiales bacterium]|nr:prepilin peptidase [Elusimicrobiales bacterium]
MELAVPAFILGLIFGSFLNVCIARLPKDESLSFPPSKCPRCQAPIKFYDNVPVLSFLLLRGRCRACGEPISPRYPFVELLTGLVTALFVWKWHASPAWLAVSLLSVYVLIVVSVIDFETMMISDAFSLALFVLGVCGSAINPFFEGSWAARLGSSALGSAAGAGFIWGLALLGKAIYKKEAVGEGDIFLMGAIGALCGWQGVCTTVIMASFFGSVYGVSLLLLKRADRMSHMPFGPFLALGAAINLYSLVRPEDFFFTLPF